MPFVAIHDVNASGAQRQAAAGEVTAALAQAYGVAPATVDIVFHRHGADDYARDGALPAAADTRRTIAIVQAFPRPLEQRRAAARLVTAALAGSFGVRAESVVIYFAHRGRDEAAHGGVLACDEDAI